MRNCWRFDSKCGTVYKQMHSIHSSREGDTLFGVKRVHNSGEIRGSFHKKEVPLIIVQFLFAIAPMRSCRRDATHRNG